MSGFEDGFPYTPDEFEPRLFQKEVIEKAYAARNKNPFYELARPRRFHYGIDMGRPGDDKTVITRAQINGKGQITGLIFDEFDTFPKWKWYRNPIKWWKWRKLWQKIEKSYKGIPSGRIK